MDPVDVAVRTSDPITRAGVVSVLRPCPQVRVLDEADHPRASVVVVVEESVTDEVIAGLRALRAAAGEDHRAHCVVVTDHFRSADILAAVECGVVAVLPRRDTGPERLVSAVLGAGDGTAHLPPRLQGSLLAQLERMRRDVLEPRDLTLSGLAGRERDVLRLVAEGLGTDEIALRLSYSERTVKNVLAGLMSRCQLNNRAHAVAYAMRAGAI